MTLRLSHLAIGLFAITVTACGASQPTLGGGGDASDSGGSSGEGAAVGPDGGTGDDGGPDATTANGDDGPDATTSSGDDGSMVDGTLGDDGSLSDGPASDGTPGDDGPNAVGNEGGGDTGIVPGDTGMPAEASPGGDTGTPQGSDGGPSVSCLAFGTSCTYGAQCCTGLCDPTGHTCLSSITTCAPATAACVVNTDCCTGACVSGQCGTTQCLTLGATCPVAGNACCTGNCSAGTCQAVGTAGCTQANNKCTSSGQCCSGLCANGLCAIAASYCIQTGDVCYRANDCCGGICNAPNAQAVTATNPGTCSQPASGSVNCSAVDGTICPGGGCGQCCSRLCAPYGPSGVNICQPARGCRVEGDLCRENADCCGATGSGVLGDGQVTCSNAGTTVAVGVCLTPLPAGVGVCVPEGDVCHYTAANYTCGISSARSDCCGPQRPKYDACVLDPFGVPRCNAYTGVGPDAGLGCIAPTNDCATATECCNGHPCVPSATGQLQCSPNSCQPAGYSCTTNADCCPGLPCIAPPGSLQGTCTAIIPPPPPPPPPPPDGGSGGSGSSSGSGSGSSSGAGSGGSGTSSGAASTGASGGSGSTSGSPNDAGISPDGGYVCGLYGQDCSSLPCCAGTQCIGGICITP